MQSRRFLLKAVLFLSLCSFGLSVYAAPVSKALSKNEELYPQGWSVGDQVKFKKDTSVLQNDDDTVISGVLASDTFLRPQGWQRIINDYYFVSAYTSGGPFFLGITAIGITAMFTALLCPAMAMSAIKVVQRLRLARRALLSAVLLQVMLR